MAGDDPITSVYTLGDGPNDPQPVVNLAGSDDPLTSIHNQSQPEPDLSDPVMHFVVQNFNQINAMYVAFYTKRKEITSQQIFNQINAMYVASITESRKTKIVLLSEKTVKLNKSNYLEHVVKKLPLAGEVTNCSSIYPCICYRQPETIKQSILHAANKLHTINWRGAPSQGNSATPRRHVKNPSSKLL
ncbi:hypothetical protein Tco_0212355 [Tanacetum coccineum]